MELVAEELPDLMSAVGPLEELPSRGADVVADDEGPYAARMSPGPPPGPPLAPRAAPMSLARGTSPEAEEESGAPTLTQTLTAHHGFRRAAQSAALFRSAAILWIDDDPASIAAEIAMFEVLGGRVDVATDSAAALELLSVSLSAEPYRIIVSDVRRGGRPDEGVQALEQIRALAHATPVVFYVAKLDPDRGVPAGAYGITDDTDELVHLVMDVLQGR